MIFSESEGENFGQLFVFIKQNSSPHSNRVRELQVMKQGRRDLSAGQL
jgi:hypothetical protein